jgi:hypothetical protein
MKRFSAEKMRKEKAAKNAFEKALFGFAGRYHLTWRNPKN